MPTQTETKDTMIELKLEDMLFSVIFTREEDRPDDDPPCESQLGWNLTDSYDFVLEKCPACEENDPEKFIISENGQMSQCKTCGDEYPYRTDSDPVPCECDSWPFRSSRKFGAVLTFEEWKELLENTGISYECNTMGMLGAPGASPWYGWMPAISFAYDDDGCRLYAYVCPLPAVITDEGIDVIPGVELPLPEELLDQLFKEMKEEK